MLLLFLQVWEGLGVVATGRQMLGETDPVRICSVNCGHLCMQTTFKPI